MVATIVISRCWGAPVFTEKVSKGAHEHAAGHAVVLPWKGARVPRNSVLDPALALAPLGLKQSTQSSSPEFSARAVLLSWPRIVHGNRRWLSVVNVEVHKVPIEPKWDTEVPRCEKVEVPRKARALIPAGHQRFDEGHGGSDGCVGGSTEAEVAEKVDDVVYQHAVQKKRLKDAVLRVVKGPRSVWQ